MDNYIINNDVLCFTQNSENEILVVEKSGKYCIEGKCLKFLKKSCSFFGRSYNMQRQYIIDNFNYYIKTPIILSEFNMIIFFPTTSPNSNECIWISYNNIDRYVKDGNYTIIYFKGGKILKIDTPFNTIDNQITRCIKIEKFVRNRNTISTY